MALKKSKELESGLVAEYWRVYLVSVNNEEDITRCFTKLYKDAASRQADKSPVRVSDFSWSGEDNPCTIEAMDAADANPIKLCYVKLKTLPEFDGAEDV